MYFIILYKTLNLHSRVRSDGRDDGQICSEIVDKKEKQVSFCSDSFKCSVQLFQFC